VLDKWPIIWYYFAIMIETISTVPEDIVKVESGRSRITRKYILPLAIVFSLGIAGTATVGEVYSIVNWDEIEKQALERQQRHPDLLVDDTNDGIWPDASDVGMGGVMVGGLVLGTIAFVQKRRMDREISSSSSINQSAQI